jgi:glycolate oxidase
VHHVSGLEIVTPDGELTWLGDGTGGAPGYDLVGAFTGSEGTLGIVTKVVVRLTPIPQAVTTLLAAFETMGHGGAAVSAIIGAGILPAAIEMMDALAIEAAEAAVACRYPDGAGAVLIVELDGPEAEVRVEVAAVRAIATGAGAFEIREAADPAERAAIWTGRRSAFAAMGRISPAYIVQDGVVPRTALPAVLDQISALSAETGIRVANVFHAGDGNLHPLVLFDDASPEQTAAAEELSGASTASVSTSRGTCQKCSGLTTWTPCSCSAVRSTPVTSAIPARSSPPRGCAARSPASGAARIRWWPLGKRRSSDDA